MLTDAALMFSDGQNITGTGSLASTNVIDMQQARDIERSGKNLRLVSEVTVSLAGGTSIAVVLQQSAAAAMSSPDTLYTGPTVALASAVAGAKLCDTRVPSPAPNSAKRFWGVFYTLVGTFTGSGAVWTGLVMDDEGGELRLGQIGF